MNYHNIKHCDMINGTGLRVTLFVSGCCHNCPGCHNPQTHDPESGIPFDDHAKQEIFRDLEQGWCSGVTLSGGDPLHPDNRESIYELCKEIKAMYPTKTIWIYTGYSYAEIQSDDAMKKIVELCDVLVDGVFIKSKHVYGLRWRGSTNQRVIDLRNNVDLV